MPSTAHPRDRTTESGEADFLRLFVALQLPHTAVRQLLPFMELLKQGTAGVKWEAERKLHLTLKFLGDCPRTSVPGIVSALGSIPPRLPGRPEVFLENIRIFPSEQTARVVAVDVVDRSGILIDLAGAVERQLVGLGFEPEHRPFTPHVTLGRIRDRRSLPRLIEMIETVTFRSDLVVISEFVLIRSTLTPGGSVYTRLERFSLGGAVPGSSSPPDVPGSPVS